MYSLILHGKRLGELQKWRYLSFVVQNGSAFSNSYSSASAADVSLRDGQKGKNFTVSYLIDSLGLAKKLSESISRKVTLVDKVNPDSVLSLLRSYGFTDSQISSIIRTDPRLLITDAEISLGPKLQFLQSRGASSSELTEIVSTVPEILGKKEGKSISRYYDSIKDIIEADKSCMYKKLSQSLPEGSKQDNKIRNVSVLRELGVPQRLLFSLLISDAQPVCGKEKFEESLKKVVEMGFDPTTSKFVQALKVVYRTSDKTIEEKINVYKRLGFAVGDVWAMFKKLFKKFPQCIAVSEKKIANSIELFIDLGFSRDELAIFAKRFPQCFVLSAETVKKKTEFVVKKMNWPLKAVVSTPAVLGYSLEKRTIPRCNVIKALMSKGLIERKLPPMSTVLVCTDEAFLNRYVRNHDEKELGTELMAIFTRARAS
ncbi:Transcription termination factor MTERF4 [Cardamine amara subsp. amara]|uniref:Transcription termination factor MTERF4 n=1 Tax=Cardamine amara subsp. amara TaxID=228776 RepID=A0ABD1BHV4_CARAN